MLLEEVAPFGVAIEPSISESNSPVVAKTADVQLRHLLLGVDARAVLSESDSRRPSCHELQAVDTTRPVRGDQERKDVKCPC
jgi:hypothetical protein